MKTNGFLAMVLVLAGALAFAAAPTVSNVRFTPVGTGRTVKIEYDYRGDAGIVTMDVQTNTLANGTGDWVSIGIDNFAEMVGGDMFCYTAGAAETETRSLFWRPHMGFPNQNLPSGATRVTVTAWATNAPPTWLVIPMDGVSKKRYYVDKVPGDITDRRYKVDNLVMRKVPAAGVTFRMGKSGYIPYSTVSFTADYYLAVYEFTKGQMSKASLPDRNYSVADEDAVLPYSGYTHIALRGSSSGYFYTSTNPAKSGNNVGAGSYIDTLRNKYHMLFDLPSRAEWEYAGRAGIPPETFSKAWLLERAWVWDNCEGVVQPVGLKMSNNWGFYDMIGNLVEVTLDIEGGSYDGVTDPHGKVFNDGTDRVSQLMWYCGYGCNRTYDYYGAEYSLRSDTYSGYGVSGGGQNNGHGPHGLRLWAAAVVCD